MASPTKRKREDLGTADVKKAKGNGVDDRLETFLSWCKDSNFQINPKVVISKQGSCAQYGMMAVDDIDEGEVLFQIPRPFLLHPETSGIADLLKKEAEKIKSPSGWVPLLLALMHEYTNPDSKWKSYVRLVPDFDNLHLAMFWEREQLTKDLKNTGVIEMVDRDLKFIQHEFSDIVLPFIKAHPDMFPEECQNLEFFKKMVAFVMAYSFTEPLHKAEEENEDNADDDDDDDDEQDIKSPPMMVPVADILNHVAKHNAHLQFEKECLKMVSIKPIKKEEEVYNTYGTLANWQLLHLYGFAEPYPENHNDTVDIPVSRFYEAAKQCATVDDAATLPDKWKFLEDAGLVAEDAVSVLGVSGFATEEETATILKVLTLDKAKFSEYQKDEGWEEENNEEEEDENLTNENIPKLPQSWRTLLTKMTRNILKDYGHSAEEDKEMLKEENFSKLSTREKYALHVRHGQKQLLLNLIELCAKA